MNNGTHKVFCAGFGGQGIMLMGQLLSYAGMVEGKEVTWCPSYGPEMRGGTANCSVVVSSESIAAPVITSGATTAVVMNKPSLEKFEDIVSPGGSIFVNSSLIDDKVKREDVNVYYVPVNDIARDMGQPKLANIIMLGAILEKDRVVDEKAAHEAINKYFGSKKAGFVEMNRMALEEGAKVVREA